MTCDNVEIATRPMTPDEVFAALARDYRVELGCADEDRLHDLDDEDRGFELRPETTVHDWGGIVEREWMRWPGMVRTLNERFGTCFTRAQWASVLTPRHSRTVRDVCALIATQARVPIITPARVLGRSCRSAGAFITIRGLLAQAGADVTGVRPSTRLEPYLRTHGGFLRDLVNIAPDRIPRLDLGNTIQVVLGLIAVAATFVGACSAGFQVVVPVMACCTSLFLLIAVLAIPLCCAAGLLRPTDVHLGDLHTFRDLSLALVSKETAS